MRGNVRQGLTGRGKEIYDPASNAWYWLDSNADGKMAVSKDVYQPYTIQGQDEIGKWVRYDEYGHMIKVRITATLKALPMMPSGDTGTLTRRQALCSMDCRPLLQSTPAQEKARQRRYTMTIQPVFC